MTDPLVSIIIPTYNRAHIIGETLNSVLAQTYENWECIVIDDGSTDGTAKLLESYIQKDYRFQYHFRPSNRPKGASACRNYGFDLSKGEYINWLDSDDLLSQDKIFKQVEKLIKNTKLDIATCKWFYSTIKEKRNNENHNLPVYKSFGSIPEYLNALAQSGGFMPIHAYLISRKLLLKAGDWLEGLKINQDGEYITRIFLRAEKVLFASEVEVFYRLNELESHTSVISEQKVEHAIQSWKLIDAYFNIKIGEEIKLVKVSKRYLYNRIKIDYPHKIHQHKCFFLESKKENIFYRLKRFIGLQS